jgi:hypothetical protein
MDFTQTDLGSILKKANTQLYLKPIWYAVFSDVKFKETILNWIKQDQLIRQGIDENGRVIGRYSEFTERVDPRKVAGTPYTLYDTGEFFRSMFISVLYDASIVIDADADKTDYTGAVTNLFDKFGEGIVGLTEFNREKLIYECIERFNSEARAVLLND